MKEYFEFGKEYLKNKTGVMYEELEKMHEIFIIFLKCIIALILLCYILNLLGVKVVSVVVIPILAVSTLMFAFVPKIIVSLLGLGTALGAFEAFTSRGDEDTIHRQVPEEVKAVFVSFKNAVICVLFWVSVIFWFLGTISFRGEYWWTFFPILSAAIIIGLISIRSIQGDNSKFVSFVRKYCIVHVIFFLLLIIPPSGWVQVTGGWYPQMLFAEKPDIEAMNDVKKEKEREKAKERADRIRELGSKDKLEGKEKEEWKKLNEEIYGQTIPGKISGVAESLKSRTEAKVEKPEAKHQISRDILTSKSWKFSRDNGSVISRNVKLFPDGKIEGIEDSRHTTEFRWGTVANASHTGFDVAFFHENGAITTRFKFFEKKQDKWTISGPHVMEKGNPTYILTEEG